MKLINEKGKLFGIINLVDLACLLLVLLIIFGVGWKILGSKVEEIITTPASEMTTMTTTIRIRGVYDYTQDWLAENSLVGQQLVAGTEYVEDSYVVDMYYEPYIMQSATDEGVIVDAVDPTKVDVIVVLETPVEKDSTILKIATQEVRVGRSFVVKTHTFEMTGLVDSVVVE